MKKRGAEDEEAIGLECPRCGCREFDTRRTVRVKAGMIRRYKRCRYCQRGIVTHEATTLRQLHKVTARGS